MGSRGQKSAQGGGATSATTVRTQIGGNADLTGSPLKYSNPKHGLSDTQLKKIEQFEKDKLGKKSEYGMILDADGNVIGEKRGGKGSVSMYRPMATDTFVHTHPRSEVGQEDGCLGGTFSVGDVHTFAVQPERTMIASTFEGRYSMTKGKNFDARGLVGYANQVGAKWKHEYEEKMQPHLKSLRSGKMTWNDYVKTASKEFNARLVGMHNDFLAGQKKYGYTYGLERTK